MSKGNGSDMPLCSRDGIIAAFQQDIINAIRNTGSFSGDERWYRGYKKILLGRGLNQAEIRRMEDVAIAAAKEQFQLSHA